MTETRINPGELPYGTAYGLPPYPSPPYGDPLGLDPLAPHRREPDAWAPGATAPPPADAWTTGGSLAGHGVTPQQATSWDAPQSFPWSGNPEAPWGISQSGQIQVGATGTNLPYGNPISPPYGVAPYGNAADPGLQPAQPPAASSPYGYGDQQTSGYNPAQPAYPSGQYQAPQPQTGAYAQPASYPDYAAPSGQYPSAQYPATSYTGAQYAAPSGQYPAQPPSGQYPVDPAPYATGSYATAAQSQYSQYGQYAAPSGEFSAPYAVPAPAPAGQYPVQYATPAPSGQYPAQALSGQYPAVPQPVYQGQSGAYPQLDQYTEQTGQVVAPSDQYPVAQPAVPAVTTSGQYTLPFWAGSTTGSQPALPAPRELEGPTGQHERIRQGKKSRAAARIETARVAADEDAKFLSSIKALLKLPSMFPRMIFIALGFTAIGPLALAYVEVMPLSVSARLILLPATLIMVVLGMRYREWGRRALIGWVAGIIATIIYDCLRLSLVQVGIWGDPIPGIGRLLLDDPEANWMWGYAWRFLGNGGGMAIAFTMLPWRGVRAGIIYGTMICLGLVAVLAFWPVAQEHFFPLTPITAAGGMAGHWIYGAVLGFITSRFLPPVRVLSKQGKDQSPFDDGYRPAHATA